MTAYFIIAKYVLLAKAKYYHLFTLRYNNVAAFIKNSHFIKTFNGNLLISITNNWWPNR